MNSKNFMKSSLYTNFRKVIANGKIIEIVDYSEYYSSNKTKKSQTVCEVYYVEDADKKHFNINENELEPVDYKEVEHMIYVTQLREFIK